MATGCTNLRNIRIIDGLLLLAKPKQRLGIPPPTSSVPLPLTREAIAECEHLALNNNLSEYKMWNVKERHTGRSLRNVRQRVQT